MHTFLGRGFYGSGSTLWRRDLINVLLQLCEIAPQLKFIPQLETTVQKATLPKFENIMKAIILLNIQDAVPATRNLARYIVLSQDHKSQPWVEKIRSENSESWMEEMRQANSDLVLQKDEVDLNKVETHQNLEKNIKELINLDMVGAPRTSEDLSKRRDLLSQILGYELVSDLPRSLFNKHDIHVQRAREIIGPAIIETMEYCAAIWHTAIQSNSDCFWGLVHLYNLFGSTSHEQFQIAFARIQKQDLERDKSEKDNESWE
ncbi:hypothetical protein B0O99DRAFT_689656 [Bisporella sp. PMI_857]|nr:hypothetical protein B0O99DRAFT_689656 [Bisporella sp. PMI_857]